MTFKYSIVTWQGGPGGGNPNRTATNLHKHSGLITAVLPNTKRLEALKGDVHLHTMVPDTFPPLRDPLEESREAAVPTSNEGSTPIRSAEGAW